MSNKFDLVDMTPKERVFETLRNVLAILREAPELETQRKQLCRSLENAISWEPELVNKQ